MGPEKEDTELLAGLRVTAANLSVCRGSGGFEPESSERWALDAVAAQLRAARLALAARDFVGGPVRLVMLQDAVDRLRRRGMTRPEHAAELDAMAAELRAAGAAFAADAAAVSAFSESFSGFLAGCCARPAGRPRRPWREDFAFFGAFTDRVLRGAFAERERPVREAVDRAFARTYTRRVGLRREAAARCLARPPAPSREPAGVGLSAAEHILLLPYLAVPVGVYWLATSLIPGGWGVALGLPLALAAFLIAGTLYTPELIVLLVLGLGLWMLVKALLRFIF